MQFRVLIIGEKSVGKGSFIHMCRTGEFNNLAPINCYLDCPTNYGIIRLYLTQSHNYEKDHDAELIMVDSSKFTTLKILRQVPHNNTPRIIVGNKFDLKHNPINFPEVEQKEITSRKYPYFNISVIMKYGILEVISYLLKQLVAEDIYLV